MVRRGIARFKREGSKKAREDKRKAGLGWERGIYGVRVNEFNAINSSKITHLTRFSQDWHRWTT